MLKIVEHYGDLLIGVHFMEILSHANIYLQMEV
jgi:hypothetical protein